MSQEALKAVATGKTNNKPATLASFINDDKMKAQIAHALPKHIKPDRMIRIITTELRKNPQLATCDKASFLSAIMQASQLGLEPSGTLGHCYLIPFKNNTKGITECQFIIGYRGMIDLARRSGQMVSLSAIAVYEKDQFDYTLGLHPNIEHKPSFEDDRGALVFVYAVANLKDGGVQFEVMSKPQVDKIRALSKARNSPWVTHYEEMAKKTVIRRLFKYLPVSTEYLEAVIHDENVDLGIQDDFIETDYSHVEETPELEHQQAEQVDLNTGEILQPEKEPVPTYDKGK